MKHSIDKELGLKTLTIPVRTAVFLTIRLQGYQAQREELRIVKDIIERLGISNSMEKYIKPIDDTRSSISRDIDDLPPIETTFSPSECRTIIKILNESTLTVQDLSWVDPLIEQLEEKK